ncbi:SAM-dependent methyltransferase [Winogradskyella aurantia]|uniref:SAM-dependent methyltransferase n=2 Tax=Winogradskyella aurantia TaxID=1915063 RepID=A0A265UPJ5_9FLAO|nr:SAM-dependent methyltransferase [Winogradskyella aurantia]
MNQIYDKHLWGGIEFDFYSGEGSHNLKITSPYIDAVRDFLKSQNNSLTVCDLGCGDFNIGKHFVEYTYKYTGIDIVESLIERNKAIFKADNLEFHCLDISKDKLPKADCVILRQVLQHLSNPEIKNVVNKLTNYKYIILTEHLPLGDFEPNKDKIASQGIRLKQNSGVDILASPFNLEIIEEVMLLNIVLESNRDCIATSIYKCF